MFKSVLVSGLVAGVALAGTPNSAEPAKDPDVGDRIVQAAVYDGKLWLRGTPSAGRGPFGSLITIDLATESRTLLDKSTTAAIVRGFKDLWVLRSASGSEPRFVLAAWRGGKLSEVAPVQLAKDDVPIALAEVSGAPAVISFRTVQVWSSAKNAWTTFQLDPKNVRGVPVAAASRDGKMLYLGFDGGEFGGGMIRIDLGSGTRSIVEKREGGLCGGDLNGDCDPITGIIPDPQRDDCVIASGGLSHFTSWGRILRICGEKVSVIYKDESNEHFPGGDFPVSVPFFALAPATGGFWTVSFNKVFRFENDRLVRTYDLPKLESLNGIFLSRAIPGLAIVRTDVNWGMSLSGYTPLIVSTE